jgi:hypothetical protein
LDSRIWDPDPESEIRNENQPDPDSEMKSSYIRNTADTTFSTVIYWSPQKFTSKLWYNLLTIAKSVLKVNTSSETKLEHSLVNIPENFRLFVVNS